MKILFLTVHSVEVASTRYRVFQYLPYFKKEGVESTIKSFFISSKPINMYQTSSDTLYWRLKAGIRGFLNELTIWLCGNKYDVIIIHRDLMLWGPPFIDRLKWLRKLGKPIMIDYDDALWVARNSHKENPLSQYIKRIVLGPYKDFETLLHIATHVIAGNNYLADYAKKFNLNVSIIPTTVDTDRCKPKSKKKDMSSKVVIGWIGSPSPFLQILNKVWQKLPGNAVLKIIGNSYKPEGIEYINAVWNSETELNELTTFDIGITPLPDDEWTRGKCGFKTLQYMSAAIPAVSSPVGVNSEIIHDGVNGFLARNEEEWIEKLTLLIENPELRQRIGMAGRRTVEEKYSVKVWTSAYLKIIRDVIEKYATDNA